MAINNLRKSDERFRLWYLRLQRDSTRMKDFERLAQRYKELNIKFILNFVPNHSSDQHEWLKKSSNPNDPEYKKYKDIFHSICNRYPNISANASEFKKLIIDFVENLPKGNQNYANEVVWDYLKLFFKFRVKILNFQFYYSIMTFCSTYLWVPQHRHFRLHFTMINILLKTLPGITITLYVISI